MARPPASPPVRLILSVPEAATDILGWTPSWMYRRIKAGETFGGAVRQRPGRHMEVSRAALTAWVKARDERRYLTATQAAELYGKSASALRRELAAGETFGGSYTAEPGRIRLDEERFRAWCNGEATELAS